MKAMEKAMEKSELTTPHAGSTDAPQAPEAVSPKAYERALSAAPWWVALAASGLLVPRRTRPAALSLVAASLAATLPALRTGSKRRRGAKGSQKSGSGQSVTVVSANVLLTNTRPLEAASMLTGLDADVLVIIERSEKIASFISHALYPYRLELFSLDDRGDEYALRVLSRLPFSLAGDVSAASRRLPVLRMDAGDASFDLVGVHLAAPHRRKDVPEWRSQLTGLGESLASRTADGTPLVVCGDFNASLTHRWMRQMLRTSGLSSVLAHHLKALRPTWGPKGRIAVLPIDHVLVSDNVESDGIDVRRIPGSDHRALVATLRI